MGETVRFKIVNELRDSKQLVKKLSVLEGTKQFLFALRHPQTQSLIHILSALNLSERSAFDATCLIAEIKPDAVLVQAAAVAAVSPFSQLQSEEEEEDSIPLPTSTLRVIKRCLLDKIGADMFENVAGNLVLREIFGTGFHGPLLAAKRAAEDVGSSFLVRQQHAASWAPSALKRFSLDKELRMMLAKALSGNSDPLLLSSSVLERGSVEEIYPSISYETPGFARGEVLDKRTVSEVYTFRVAVEGLRIALNNKGLRPVNRKGAGNSDKIEFSDLPIDDKSHALFAQAIRSQTVKFKTIVVVVDASALSGLRKHWDTPLPVEVKELVGELITNSEGKGVMLNHNEKKRLLTDKPMVAVGAGATAVLGASSLTKVVPASTLVKVVTFKIPTSLKIGLSQMQKVLAFAFGPSKVVAPGIATSGAKTSGIMKAAVSTEKIRAVAHSVIASAGKNSISVMRRAFYEIMGKRKVQPVGFLPWATLAGCIGTSSGLLLYGDGIECAVESLPAAPSIASLGRGIQHLHEASQAVMQTEGSRIQASIESLIKRIKKARD
ncbi:hypothetical protein JHK82_053476 [Glycine max]|nr:hypothetical protein JHK86_053327 [Glycine max]KAG4927782.1 hypothetical protein JHK85_054268 [Glycine max]KAG5083307.1 hypothetical protein JHK84_053345 [Glycine max]KAG5086079.1 hypothetical protein JHK82_053476 [Glycine max]